MDRFRTPSACDTLNYKFYPLNLSTFDGLFLRFPHRMLPTGFPIPPSPLSVVNSFFDENTVDLEDDKLVTCRLSGMQ